MKTWQRFKRWLDGEDADTDALEVDVRRTLLSIALFIGVVMIVIGVIYFTR